MEKYRQFVTERTRKFVRPKLPRSTDVALKVPPHRTAVPDLAAEPLCGRAVLGRPKRSAKADDGYAGVVNEPCAEIGSTLQKKKNPGNIPGFNLSHQPLSDAAESVS